MFTLLPDQSLRDVATLRFEGFSNEEIATLAHACPGNWITTRAAGAEHNERAWRARLDKPLIFLFGNRT